MGSKDAQKKQGRQSARNVLFGIGVLAACLVCSAGTTVLVARINGAKLGIYLLPFMVSVGIFTFSTLGFFMTEGKKEALYGVCSIAGAACAIVQLALVF